MISKHGSHIFLLYLFMELLSAECVGNLTEPHLRLDKKMAAMYT